VRSERAAAGKTGQGLTFMNKEISSWQKCIPLSETLLFVVQPDPDDNLPKRDYQQELTCFFLYHIISEIGLL
jgi:hypothetical protein